jgi:cell division protein FtsQ
MRRTAKKQNPPAMRRVVRPPREEIPEVIYTAPKPLTRGRFALSLVSVAAVVAAVFLGLSVFFRVETIAVAGAEKYTPWMIRQAAGVEPGDALLSIGEARVASRIRMKLPYVDEIKVGIRLPGTVEIQITELQVTYSIEDENGAWWLISADGRAVEQVTLDKALSYTRVEGLTIRTPQPGEQVQAIPGQIIDPDEGTSVTMEQAYADDQLDALITVMTALEANRIIGQVARIDVTNPADIRLEYPQLLTVLLGDSQRMDYKVSYLAAAVAQLSDSQSGELDLSLQYREDAIFTPSR